MRTFVWPSEDGWPYPDDGSGEPEFVAADGEADDDALAVQCLPASAMKSLDDVERRVLEGRFGLGGTPVRSMKELHIELGLPRADLRAALGSGLDKLRATFR